MRTRAQAGGAETRSSNRNRPIRALLPSFRSPVELSCLSNSVIGLANFRLTLVGSLLLNDKVPVASPCVRLDPSEEGFREGVQC